MQYTTLLFDVRDAVAQIILNRPEVNNSINLDMAKELMHIALRCSEDPVVRAIIITGRGNTFCPGGDLKAMPRDNENLPYYLKEITTYLHAAVSRLTRMDAPVVVAVNGVAAGAGMSLACAGDIVLAAESARFVVAYTRAGLTPDGSLTYFLPRIVGLRRAIELILTNRQVSAHEALDLGIVTQVVPDSELLPQAEVLANQLASGATKALGMSKRLLHIGWTEMLETQMEHESQAMASMAHTSDTYEGIAAFVEKRAPKFKGQ
ncbi:MAG: enoyl-CoA hydratase [Chloroflexi bacterium]|nr:enoyl-CoA hydratase [Chloroflexota bacterium]